MTTASAVRGAALPAPALAAYGLLGMPLAMAALPLYVHLPRFYGAHLGVDLALLGGVLLALRLADGLTDPLLGALSDRAGSRKRWIALAVPLLAVGMVALFAPPIGGEAITVVWLALALALVYAAFSLATINHQAWGAELSSDPVERTRITATREALALVGVVIAAVLPAYLGGADGGLRRFSWLFGGFALACAALTLRFAPPGPAIARSSPRSLRASLTVPLADPGFRRLLLVYLLNGIAAAIPATLVLFFVADVLDAEAQQGGLLALYFVAGAAGMPLWLRLSRGVGKPLAWLGSMLVAIVAFVWASRLGAGDVKPFAVICALSGLALGADLALPPSMLADVIGRNRAAAATGSYFGLWTLSTKLNLALAAGIALPLLSALGYTPGTRAPAGLSALAQVYAFVPCALKMGAALALFRFRVSFTESPP